MNPAITQKDIDLAIKEGRFDDVARVTGIPADVLKGLRVMNRRDRRTWYHENRKRLGLPRWGELTPKPIPWWMKVINFIKKIWTTMTSVLAR